MANRWQIIKKDLARGVERTTTNDTLEMQNIVKLLQEDETTLYIVVKDRKLNRRGLIWRRNTSTEIDWWIIQELPPEITFKSRGPDKSRGTTHPGSAPRRRRAKP